MWQRKGNATVVPSHGHSHGSIRLGKDESATDSCTKVNGKLITVSPAIIYLTSTASIAKRENQRDIPQPPRFLRLMWELSWKDSFASLVSLWRPGKLQIYWSRTKMSKSCSKIILLILSTLKVLTYCVCVCVCMTKKLLFLWVKYRFIQALGYLNQMFFPFLSGLIFLLILQLQWHLFSMYFSKKYLKPLLMQSEWVLPQ